jgi:hypothetical protein
MATIETGFENEILILSKISKIKHHHRNKNKLVLKEEICDEKMQSSVQCIFIHIRMYLE